eukprot:gene44130-39696_t
MPDTETAWAIPCMTAVDLRPTVVLLNVAPNKLGAVKQLPRGGVKLRNHMLHALFHALGFHNALFGSWQQAVVNRTVPTASCSATAANAQGARHQFKCDNNPAGGSGTIGGAEVPSKVTHCASPYAPQMLGFVMSISGLLDEGQHSSPE